MMKESKDKVQAKRNTQDQASKESAFDQGAKQQGFSDNRPEAIAQRKLQSGVSQSPQVQGLAQLQANANGKADSPVVQKKENKTGLPDNLKSGIESLSGIAMDDVKVHHNSDKPAGLQAHAFAQGSDIHLAPGQEQHLAHEAWHVVQQKQGRVTPTVQTKSVAINDDSTLESEADVMGAKAVQLGANKTSGQTQGVQKKASGAPAAQLKKVYRMGSGSDQNLTPRPVKDTAGDGRGLSTSSEKPRGEKAQIIETDSLGTDLDAVNDHGKHYAIRPSNDKDNAKLLDWAASREKGGHELTEAVKGAKIGTLDAKGNETLF